VLSSPPACFLVDCVASKRLVESQPFASKPNSSINISPF
jgi:hypothetical protein